MANKPASIVTGANSGIGREVGLGLMLKGHHVTLACRNMDACEITAAELRKQASSGNCKCSHIDVGDLESVRQFAKQFKQEMSSTGSHLHVLVNNAGIMGLTKTADVTLRVNYLGPYLLTRLLLPSMAADSRIVNVSSRVHFFGQLRIEGDAIMPRCSNCGACIQAYASSPGMVATGIFRELPPLLAVPFNAIAPYIMRSPVQGAKSTLHAALSTELQGSGAVFIHDDKAMAPSAAAQDAGSAHKLWEVSERLVGLSPDYKEQSFC